MVTVQVRARHGRSICALHLALAHMARMPGPRSEWREAQAVLLELEGGPAQWAVSLVRFVWGGTLIVGAVRVESHAVRG